jgi:hypothetical protein
LRKEERDKEEGGACIREMKGDNPYANADAVKAVLLFEFLYPKDSQINDILL